MVDKKAVIEEKQRRVCKCGKAYQARIYNILGSKFQVDGGVCPKCRKKAREELDKKEAEKHTLEIARQRRLWRQASGIPTRFMHKEFGDYEKARQPKAFERCLKYAEGYPLKKPQGYNSLIMFGDWGTGKTHLACAIAHHILNRWQGENIGGCPVRYITEPGLFLQLRATYNYSPEERMLKPSEDAIFRELTSVPLLILDDVGKEDVADPKFVQRTLFKLINGRYERCLPMVITANLDEHGLRHHLGGDRNNEASFDRLIEMIGSPMLRLTGDSYRRKE